MGGILTVLIMSLCLSYLVELTFRAIAYVKVNLILPLMEVEKSKGYTNYMALKTKEVAVEAKAWFYRWLSFKRYAPGF